MLRGPSATDTAEERAAGVPFHQTDINTTVTGGEAESESEAEVAAGEFRFTNDTFDYGNNHTHTLLDQNYYQHPLFAPTASRSLYDPAYFEAKCDPDLYNPKHATDNSFATAVTNYLNAVIGWYIAYKIYQGTCCHKSRKKKTDGNHNHNHNHSLSQDDHSPNNKPIQWAVVIYFASTSMGIFIAGIVHHLHQQNDGLLYQMGWPLVSFFLLPGVACQFYLVMASLVNMRHKGWYGLWLFLSAVMVAGGTATGNTHNEFTALLVAVGVLMVFMVLALQAFKTGFPHKGIHGKIVAFAIYLAGGVVQVFLEATCGTGGYESCFADCPFPAPTFNHNAAFHLLLLVYMILWGYMEVYVLPFCDHIHVLQRGGSSSGGDKQRTKGC